jgi:hypothetical protein
MFISPKQSKTTVVINYSIGCGVKAGIGRKVSIESIKMMIFGKQKTALGGFLPDLEYSDFMGLFRLV